MKKLVLASTLLLGACTTVPGVNSPVTPPVVNDIMKIQALAVKICSFEPTAATVNAILASLVPGAAPTLTLISQVAHSICNAVAPPIQAFVSTAPTVNGVPVEGRFVKRR